MARGGSNAIGSAAVVLSANADGLVAGLSKSEARVNQFGKNVGKSLMSGSTGSAFKNAGARLGDKASTGFTSRLAAINGSGAISKLGAVLGGAAGGIAGGTAAGAGLGAMLGSFGGPGGAVIGGIAGAAAGLATGTAKAGFDMLTSLPDMVERLSKSATGSDLGVLTGLSNSFTGLQEAGDRFLTKVLVPLGPVIALAADSAGEFLDKIGPAFAFAADFGSAFLFVAVEAGKEIGDLIVKAGNMGAEWLGLSDGLVSGSALMFKGLGYVAQGAGYVWDTFKVGGGIIVAIVGKTIEGCGLIVKALGDVILKASDLASKLPEAIRPGWIKDAGDMVKGWGSSIEGLGDSWAKAGFKFGVESILSWGDSAKKFEDTMQGIENRFGQSRKKLESTAAPAKDVQFAPSAEFGSKEAYSIEIANRYANVGRNPLVAATNAAADAQKNLGKIIDDTNTKWAAQGDALLGSVAQVANLRGTLAAFGGAAAIELVPAAIRGDVGLSVQAGNNVPTDSGGKSFMESARQMVDLLGQLKTQSETLNSQFRTAVANVESF